MLPLVEENQKEILVHIGLPKTATTSIQDSLYRNADYLLERHGIDYCVDLCQLANVSSTGHHPLAWAKFCLKHPHRVELNDAKVAELISARSNILLSSEWFTYANSQLSEVVEKWAFPKNRRVLLVYRNEFDYLRSIWLQSIKMGDNFLSFNEFYFSKYKPYRTSISQKLFHWKKAGFSVELVSFDALVSQRIDPAIVLIEKMYGIEVDREYWKNGDKTNVSPPVYTVDLYRRLIVKGQRIFPSFFTKCQAGEYKLLHNKLCKVIDALFPKGAFYDFTQEKIIRDDLQSLPEYVDIDKALKELNK
ncbi:hypothetical protein [Vibrio rotiferianus]|uniref:hypothetical protein n=1 Tax=Vibrio rotiferianus TaxID=190895 RepID=UPI002893D6A1|nr:hypothetical protein THOE12_130061 [Vibrio rotiferianus]